MLLEINPKKINSKIKKYLNCNRNNNITSFSIMNNNIICKGIKVYLHHHLINKKGVILKICIKISILIQINNINDFKNYKMVKYFI